MSIVINDLLGTDGFASSRIVINANFASLKNEVEDLIEGLGVSITSGNIDVSDATGGQIKAKLMAVDDIQLPSTGTSTITLDGATGAMDATTLTLDTSITVPLATVDNFVASNLGNSVFNGQATFNELVINTDGHAVQAKVDLGAVTTHTVVNTDSVLIFDSSTSLALTPNSSLVDGHIITLVRKSSSGTCTIAAPTTTLKGFSSGSVTFASSNYKSSLTLMFEKQTPLSNSRWIILSSTNVTIV